MDAGDGTFIAFATDPNSVAEDNPNELNGLFTKHLLAALSTPGLDLKQAFQRTREAVYQASGGRQRPHIDDGVIGTYYFNAPVTIVNNNPPSSDLSAQQELAFWNSVDRNDAQTLELYLERYPNGSFVSLAKRSLERLRAPALEASHVGMAAPVNHPTAGTVKTNPKDGQRYVWIPPGRFLMGCSPGDRECFDEEKPTHEVEITKGFWLGETEVTQSAYTRVSGANPSYFDGVDRPVENVNWSEAKNYCMAAGGRLPTESEWEYAARAGTTTSRYDAVNEVGWYEGNSGGRTHPVKEKKPNAWGLYDMLGNVSEWTADAYDANTKTLRGSFFRGYPRLLRVSYRLGLGPDIRNYSTGVRCAWE
jgi:formylglycine-generating enzyme required for sulfatase activity